MEIIYWLHIIINIIELILINEQKKENSQSGSRWQIPQGALFSLVSCPHYFFEVVSWLGFVIASGFSISSKYQKIRNQNCFEFVTLLSILDFTSFCAKY